MVPWRILLIDETDELRNACSAFLNGEGQSSAVSDPTASNKPFDANDVDAIVFSPHDTHAKPCDSLKKLKKMFPSASYVLAEKNLTRELIFSALHAGYTDIITRPVDSPKLYAAICRLALAQRRNGTPVFNVAHVKDIAALDQLLSPKPKSGTPPKERIGNSTPLLERISTAKQAVQNFIHHIHVPEIHHKAVLSLHRRGQPAGQVPAGGFRQAVQGIQDTTAVSQADLQVYFFGHFRVVVNGNLVEKWCSHKAKLLFAYMLLNRKHMMSRDVLMDKFWPNTLASSARDSLNVANHAIRQALCNGGAQENYILFREDCYYINPEMLVWVDVEEFMKHRQRSYRGDARMNLPIVIQELEAARRLYTADFMEEDLYDDWASMERENLREMYLDTLDRLSDCYVLTNNTPAASVLCEKILEKDNCREDIHRRLMVCYYRLGSRNKALRQFKKCEGILKAELEVVPTKPTRQLYEEIRRDRLSSSLLKHLTNL